MIDSHTATCAFSAPLKKKKSLLSLIEQHSDLRNETETEKCTNITNKDTSLLLLVSQSVGPVQQQPGAESSSCRFGTGRFLFSRSVALTHTVVSYSITSLGVPRHRYCILGVTGAALSSTRMVLRSRRSM